MADVGEGAGSEFAAGPAVCLVRGGFMDVVRDDGVDGGEDHLAGVGEESLGP